LVALPLLVAQLSFDRYDLSFIHIPANKPVHNWIGPFGAHVAYASFFVFGIGAYAFPLLVAVFGLGYLFNFWPHLRERRLWSGIWGLVLMLSLTSLLNMMDGLFQPLRENLDVQSAGGWVGKTLFQFRLFGFDWGFWVLGSVGATIVYLAFCFISLLFLTDFQLGEWIRRFLQKEPAAAEPKSADETALERRARDLEKQAKKLQEEVQRSGLGADMQPVPEPTVRDLSVPQAKPAPARARKTTLPESSQEPEAASPAKQDEPAPPREASAATTEDILGKKPETGEKPAAVKKETADLGKVEAEKSDGEKAEPVVHIADGSVPPAARPKAVPKKRKPLTVAATPIIGNYQLPPLDFLQHPDLTVKPTESKEELMARRHHQGPDHHALRIASGPRREAGKNHRAVQQHRRRAQSRAGSHPGARPRQKFRRHRSAESVQDNGHRARFVRVRGMAQLQGENSHRAGQGRLRPPDHRRPFGNAAHPHRRQHRLRQIGLHQLHHHVAALQIFARSAPIRDD
jgi:S-DNA-T family DNA segregation ATPase FtsK/SpoIIIE